MAILSTDEIESAIDEQGAFNILLMMEMVLGEKADHLRVNWQDQRSARVWEKFSKRCGALAREMEQAGL